MTYSIILWSSLCSLSRSHAIAKEIDAYHSQEGDHECLALGTKIDRIYRAKVLTSGVILNYDQFLPVLFGTLTSLVRNTSVEKEQFYAELITMLKNPVFLVGIGGIGYLGSRKWISKRCMFPYIYARTTTNAYLSPKREFISL